MSFAAMVLAAGFGTRLAPITEEIPKPLVPVGDRPLLLAILENLLEQGASELAVNVHYRGEEIIKKIESLNNKIHVLLEPRILGTAGGLRGAYRALGVFEMVLVNGDIWGPLPILPLLGQAGPGLTLALSPAQDNEGTVGVGEGGEVVRLRGETFGREVSSGNYMGVAHAGHDCLANLPEQGCLVGDYALPLLRRGGRVRTLLCSEPFIDVGTISQYLAANLDWLQARRDRGVGLEGDETYLARGARVASDVRCRKSIVGENAIVKGRGELRECVVFPGAHAQAPLVRSIVLPSGRVVVVPDHAARGSGFALERKN